MLNISYNAIGGAVLNLKLGWASSSGKSFETIVDALAGSAILPSSASLITRFLSPPISSVWHLSGVSTQFQNLSSSLATITGLNTGVVIGGNYPSQQALPFNNAGLLLAGSSGLNIQIGMSGIVQAVGGVTQRAYYTAGQQNVPYLTWNSPVDITNNDLIQVNVLFNPSGITPVKFFFAFMGTQEPL